MNMKQVVCVNLPHRLTTMKVQTSLPATTCAVVVSSKKGADVVPADHLWCLCCVPHFNHWFFVVEQAKISTVCITCVDDGESECSSMIVACVAKVECVSNFCDVVNCVHFSGFLC